MIQSVLIFILGFLSALFLALLLLPAVWRRAVRLTTRGIERTMPISIDEMRASQDQMRARQAVELRRVEIERDEAIRRSTALAVDSSKARKTLEHLMVEQAEFKERARQAEEQAQASQANLQARDQLVAQFANKTREAEDVLAGRIEELNRLGHLYEEASLASSARQVEVAARDSEVERLSRQLAELQREPKARTNVATDQAVAEALKIEQARSAELALRLEQMAADIRKRDENITQKSGEIARLREQAEVNAGGDLRLVDLQRENMQLVTEIESLRASAGGGDAALRETMHELAAKVVGLVAGQAEQAEPIDKALSLGGGRRTGVEATIISLADRIRKSRAAQK